MTAATNTTATTEDPLWTHLNAATQIIHDRTKAARKALIAEHGKKKAKVMIQHLDAIPAALLAGEAIFDLMDMFTKGRTLRDFTVSMQYRVAEAKMQETVMLAAGRGRR